MTTTPEPAAQPRTLDDMFAGRLEHPAVDVHEYHVTHLPFGHPRYRDLTLILRRNSITAEGTVRYVIEGFDNTGCRYTATGAHVSKWGPDNNAWYDATHTFVDALTIAQKVLAARVEAIES